VLGPSRIILAIIASSLLYAPSALSYEVGSRLRATGGVHQVEGSAGGGLVPWAVIAGYGQRGEVSANAFSTFLSLDNYNFAALGVSVGISDRIELSLAHQQLDIGELGLPIDELSQDSLGIKVRLFNNLIYDSWPQISAGAQFKKNDDFTIPNAVGALDDQDTDYYLSASKLWLSGVDGYPFLLNATARYTKANQIGLLGFGGDLNEDKESLEEVTAALLLSHNVATGAEYRQKPHNFRIADEEDWADVLIAWFPSKHLSVTVAYAELGNIALYDQQQGFYLSVQGTL